jgi:hypothetical protein
MNTFDIKNNINIVNKNGNTLLHLAAYEGKTELCELLLLLMSDEAINKLNNKGVSALHLATQNCFDLDVSYIIYEKMSPEIVNVVDEDGNTLLYYILTRRTWNEDKTIKLFKFYFSKMKPEIINTVNKEGMTILHTSIEIGMHELAKLLIKGLKI